MAKIYVSSTFNDLEACRRQVSLVIRKMGHEDVAMEYYIAEDKRPIDKCLEDVANCDLYIGIFAWRYGWVPKKSNPKKLSITELEYRQAVKTKKTCLIFLLDDKALWLPALSDDNRKRVKKLRDELSEEHGAGLFTSAENIGSVVAPAIHEWMKKSGLLIAGEPIAELNLENYYNALRKRYNVLALEGLTPPQKEEYLQIQLRSVFVEQSVREDTPPVELPKEVWEKLSREQEIHAEDLPSGFTLDDVRQARESYYQKPPRLALDALTDSRNKCIIVLGDPGSGKSTLARFVILSLIDLSLVGDKIQKAFESYLPLLIELRTFAGLCAEGKCETPLEFLEHLGKTEGWGLTQTALHNHLKNDGRAVVIFDGLDEIFEPKLRETITNRIVGFTNAYPKARVIVTSRILGYRRRILSNAGFTHFTLQDLDEKQVEAFITKWYQLAMSDRPDEAQERSERILKSFKDSASIRQLAGNPMLLTIMAIIGKHQELPRERWKLYDHAASVLIQHWDVNKHLKDERIEADFIGEDDKKELLRRLAYRMQSGDGGLAGNYIHREGLQAEFESYLKERYSQTPDRAKVIAEAMIQQFRERNFILLLYGANLYGFVHRAFLEYFCASAFVWEFEKTKELTIEQLKTDVYGRHWKDQSWHEVLRLICGMIDEKWTGEIVAYLSSNVFKITPKGLSKRKPKPWNIVLALECLGEINNLNLVANPARHLLNAVCLLMDEDLRSNWSGDSFVQEQVIPATKRIGHGWSDQSLLVRWLQKEKNFTIAFVNYRTFGDFISSVGIGSNEVHEIILKYANNRDEEYRIVVPYSLALGWHDDPQSVALLHDFATQDTSGWVRRAAVDALAEHYHKDAQTLPLLLERAVQDENGVVRGAAVSALAEYYHEDAEILLLLREWVVKSEHSGERGEAVKALAKYYHEDVQTLPLLRECAVQDDPNAQRAAVSAIIEHYREDAGTLPLLRERVVQDDNSEIRSIAVLALAKYYHEDDETLSLLREHAMQDEDEWVRGAAVEALAKYYHEDDEILSLLRERAMQDENGEVRSAAVKALAKYYHEDDETLSLLREHAVQDKDWQVRSAAVEALAEHYREDPQTLPLLQEWVVKSEHF
ncbi:MAG: HEAT repeat domain-containing protein, partial [Anaerolineales bacterium]|nr:HEAT repeat domain-containing protein [Anaerolineales bacterium]